jgi:hypothetical protein
MEKLRWPLQKNVTCKCDIFTNTVIYEKHVSLKNYASRTGITAFHSTYGIHDLWHR